MKIKIKASVEELREMYLYLSSQKITIGTLNDVDKINLRDFYFELHKKAYPKESVPVTKKKQIKIDVNQYVAVKKFYFENKTIINPYNFAIFTAFITEVEPQIRSAAESILRKEETT